MQARTYTYYDAANNVVKAPVDMQGWQWAEKMKGVEPVRCRGHQGLPYVACTNSDGDRVSAVRVVAYKNRNPSKHECGAKCRNATGPNCECSCGGEHHGADA